MFAFYSNIIHKSITAIARLNAEIKSFIANHKSVFVGLLL
jgi:hypothetical protein